MMLTFFNFDELFTDYRIVCLKNHIEITCTVQAVQNIVVFHFVIMFLGIQRRDSRLHKLPTNL